MKGARVRMAGSYCALALLRRGVPRPNCGTGAREGIWLSGLALVKSGKWLRGAWDLVQWAPRHGCGPFGVVEVPFFRQPGVVCR
jgi:hypothetical protein